MIAWRRRAIERQLPTASFPAGAAAPSLVYLAATAVVAIVAVVGLAVQDGRGVPAAVQDSQRELVAGLARELSGTVSHEVDELDRTVAGLVRESVPPEAELLPRVTDRSWTAAAVVDSATGRLIAARGTPIALTPADTPTAVATTGDAPVLVHRVALDATRTLVAQRTLELRALRLNADAGHGILIASADGAASLRQGVSPVDPLRLSAIAAGLTGVNAAESHTVPMPQQADKRIVVSAAPIGDTGAVIVSLVVADVVGGGLTLRGAVLALSLLIFAGMSFGLMRAALVRPVRVLLQQAKDDACGDTGGCRHGLRTSEAYRVAQALALSSIAGLRRRRWRPSARLGLIAAGALALLWPTVAIAATVGAAPPTLAAQLIFDQESQAEAATTELGNVLERGLLSVTRVARSAGSKDADRITTAMREALADDSALRGIYLVNGKGTVQRSAGRESLRGAEPVPGDSGIQLDGSVRRLPVVYAYHVSSDGNAVVGEFDLDYLRGLLRPQGGRARVVDAKLRTVLDSEGYRAFQPLTGDAARDVARAALPGGTAGRARDTDGRPALVAGSGLAQPKAAAHLEWVVVIERDVAALALPDQLSRRWTLLVAGLVAGVAGLTLAWQYLVVVGPLSRLARDADRIAAGGIDEPVTPQRHDEIGAVAICLELSRRIRNTGSARRAGPARLRGHEEDVTAVLARMPTVEFPKITADTRSTEGTTP